MTFKRNKVSNKIIHKLPLFATLLIAVALFVYIVLRAIKVGFTHDESSSFMNLIQESLQDLFFSERNWQAANNHIINTICMQIGYRWFGADEWALRWGSIAAGLGFLLYAFRAVRLWLPVTSWWFFGAFCILVLNHFLLDFFSLARGYGLSVAFEMAMLYYFFRWIKQQANIDLLKAACALGLGILSNFTLLDVMAAFFITVSIAFYVNNRNNFSIIQYLKFITLPALPVLVTLLLIFQPIRWINAKGEFEYGPQAFWETWRVLFDRWVYHPAIGYQWVKVVALVVATGLFLRLGYVIIKRFRGMKLSASLQPSESHAVPLFYATVLTILTMLMTMVQHYLLGANYLIGRTALLFYPLLSSVIVSYLIDWQKRSFSNKIRMVWLALIGFLLINFAAQSNFRFAQEWRYDENTKDAALLANQQGDDTHKINYGVGWLYYSTTLFYQQTLGLNNITIAYNSSHDDLPWITAQPFDLIYIDPTLQPKVANIYGVFKTYPQGVMMRRK